MSATKFRKIYGGDGVRVRSRNDKSIEKRLLEKELSVEESHTPAELRHIHNCIRYTQQFKQAESFEKIEIPK